MENMKLWNAVKQPPKEALKTIPGGRLRGMTDINPQWRLEAMTAQFGPCGEGWKYTIDKLWTEPGSDGQVFCFALVSVFYRDYGKDWSKAIPGIGGNYLVEKERSGLHANDEGFKMAVTDAISVALKALGLGADVYAGRWDGSKYKEQEVALATKQQVAILFKLGSERPSPLSKEEVAEVVNYFKAGERLTHEEAGRLINSFDKVCDEYIAKLTKE